MEHFRYFPQITYSDELAVNIMVRGVIRDYILENKVLYYEYTIPDGMRPDILASKYYGNSKYTWIIFYANNIIDPIEDWPLSSREFNSYILSKYGRIESAKDLENPHHYLLDNKYVIDKRTYEDITIESSRKQAITNYQYEFELNEAKRNIQIIDSAYLFQIVNELKVLFD